VTAGVPTNLTPMEDQATSEPPGPAPSASPPPAGPAPVSPHRARPGADQADWPAKVADTVEDVVAAVHDRVVRPLMIAARAVVFGVIIGVMALVLSVLAVIILVRLLDVYAFRGRVWASDALIGALLVAAGAFAWSKRRARGTGAA